MKRCPQCNRVETDEALKFCRVDGATLVTEPPALSDEEGTAELAADASEVHTSIFPHNTRPNANRPTGPTTALPAALTGTTGSLARPKSHKTLIVISVVAIIAIGSIIGLGIAGYSYLASKSNSAIESIAVLPFENRGRTADTDYLSDGLADSLIYRLSQLPNLKVSPTSSVMKYKGQATEVDAIAKELQVDAVLSGRLMQQADNLSISVQLVDSRNNKLIWAEQYERKMSDLLATQREIATSIAQKLQLKLAGNETGITKKYTNSNEAYQLYLKGRYHYAKRTKDDLQKGVDYFQRAVALDPNFALAHAMIADSYASMPAYPYLSPGEAFPKAKAAAQRAVELDPTLSEAHSALGYSLALYDWKWAEAERAFKRAIELDEKNSLGHVRFAISYYQPTGRIAEAVTENERAVELEPVNLVARANLTWTYILAGRKTDALGNGEKLRDLEPDFVLGRYQLGLAYIANGMYEQAIELAEKPLRSDPNNQLMLQVAGYANAKLGRRNEANAVIARFKEIGKTQYVISFFVATTYAGLGEKDKAFVELEDAYRQRDWRMSAVLKTEPMIESLRDDARYKDLLKRMNLSE
jgi:TolB-like protein/Flp pilus assembly protein TadD